MERIITQELLSEDSELSLRPQYLKEYIGQQKVKENLAIFIQAALQRNESLDHSLFYGPPGLGKTTIAHIIANELGTNIKIVSGPTLEKPGDLAAILATIDIGDVLFIDEIHRMPKIIEEILYPAMEDFALDIIINKDTQARSIRIDLPPFTLVGATTRVGDIASPLRTRFGIIEKLEYYTQNDLKEIIIRTAHVYETVINESAAIELAKRSRGTPRIANRLFRRVRDFAQILGDGEITIDLTKKALDRLRIDEMGLDHTDHDYLMSIITKFGGGPVGIETIGATIGEEISNLEDMYEPYLLQIGFLKRTPRGRVVTQKAYEYLNIIKE